jgi:hypothetical protein
MLYSLYYSGSWGHLQSLCYGVIRLIIYSGVVLAVGEMGDGHLGFDDCGCYVMLCYAMYAMLCPVMLVLWSGPWRLAGCVGARTLCFLIPVRSLVYRVFVSLEGWLGWVRSGQVWSGRVGGWPATSI